MKLGGQLMTPLGRTQWAGILLAAVGAVLASYAAALSMNLMYAPSANALPTLSTWLLLLAGVAGLLGGGVWVQLTWKTQERRFRHG